GQSGAVGYNPSLGLGTSNAAVVNQGTIQADVAGGTITVYGTNDQNAGSLNALNGATLSIQGTLTNMATVSVDATSVLSLSGTLTGGMIDTQTGAQIRGSTLNGATIDGNFTVSGDNSVTVQNGLTLNGTATLGAASSNLYGYLNFMGSETLSGTGTVVFGQDSPNTLLVGQAGTTLTIGSGITVRGQSGAVGYNPSLGLGTSNAAVVNQGTIQADVSGGTITIGVTWTNDGSVEATDGGMLSASTPENLSAGTLSGGTWILGPNGTLSLGESVTTDAATIIVTGAGGRFSGSSPLSAISAAGSLEVLDGATFTIAGNLDNAGTIDLAPGTLDVTGTYTQESTGAYDVAIGGITPGSSFGQLNVSQSASLNGSLSVNLINNYAPPQGDSYQVLTFASETGNFSAEFGLYFGGGEGFSPTFSPSSNPTALDLAVISESAGTQTTVQSSENPSNYGDAVTFTATVAPSVSTDLVPTGQVTFYEGSTAVDTATLVNGAATYVSSTLAGGTYSITVQYGGDSNFSGSTSTALTQTVNPIASQTGLQSSEDPSNYGDSVTFTASISPTSSASGLATPTGQVEFYDGSTLLDTATLNGGTASYTTSSLPLGANQQIEAKYLGDTNYNPSNFTIPQTVNTPPLTDFWTGASAAHGGNDDWSNSGNWALGAPPTAAETAYFTASESQYSTSIVDTSFSIANLTIDSSWGGTVSASGSLTISGNLILASGTLGGSGAISVAGSGSQFSGGTLSGNLANAGTLTLGSSGMVFLTGTITNTGTIDVTGTGTVAITGTIDGGTVDAGTGTNLVLAGSTLSGVTVDGNFAVSGNGGVTVQNGLTLNGTATLGAASSNLYGYLNFMGSQTLSGSGTVVFGQDSPN
ncbi:MAG: beta strand repeat-containing protein, partial [Isosphaeraceae bacterium]